MYTMTRSNIEQVVNVGGALFVGSIGVTAGLVVGTMLQLFIQPNGNDPMKTTLMREAIVYAPAILGGFIGYRLAYNP
jgi:hypothetical protein